MLVTLGVKRPACLALPLVALRFDVRVIRRELVAVDAMRSARVLVGVTAPLHAVAAIICVRSQLEVVVPHASRVVAPVPHHEPIGDLAVRQAPSETVRLYEMSLRNGKDTVSEAPAAAAPLPAIA
jgi:hypothetical protein